MPALSFITVFAVLILIGVEFSVSAFINPIVWQLDPEPQQKALSLFASLLGKVMPFWYAGCLLMLVAEAWLHWHTTAFVPLTVAALLWLFVIVTTVLVLVPINNRIATRSAPDWQKQHQTWDKLHRLRILFLAIAALLLLSVTVR